MAVSTVKLNGETLMTVNDTTAAASDVTSGKYFYGADGVKTAGTSSGGGGGGSVSKDDVCFYDYDGTLLYSYSAADFANLTAMPANPSHTGLTAQGWNWTLANAKAQVTATGTCDIGQMYVTDDGKTRIYITIPEDTPSNRMTFYVRFTGSGANGVTIDWGDNSTPETAGSTTATNYPHTYAAPGDYMITLKVNNGTIGIIGAGTSATSDDSIFGNRANSNSFNRGRIRKVEIGSSVTSIGQSAFFSCYSLTSITIPETVMSIEPYAFHSCYNLTSITIPSGVTSIGNFMFNGCYSLASITMPSSVTSIGTSAFYNCSSLTSITIPDGVTSILGSVFYGCNSLTSITIPGDVTSIGNTVFQSCNSLASITIPSGVTSIGNYVFYSCNSLTSITIPSGVTSIGTQAFQNCYGLGEIHFESSTPPTVTNSNAFTGVQTDCIIYVPTGSRSAYTTATNYPSSATYTYREE